ncbi:membrane protein [Streptomyces laurentii]|uniref:Membrane protein n=1 Tax=Streptomyces laurentii TaxID=39478 RepID=A0A160NTX1_STRLU|nr:membrane protein [Streptomyces laurentii]
MGAAVTIGSFGPGAQIPLQGSDAGTAATFALASAAYRDSPVEAILDANNDWHKSTVKTGKMPKLFRPDLGEAFSRAVQVRMLGGARKALIQSFGADPRPVVEHCLAASGIRKQRDIKLTLVTAVCGVLFLPGLLLWLGVIYLRRKAAGSENKRNSALGTALLVAAGLFAALVLVKLPWDGLLPNYLRAMIVAPVIGWFLARRICESTAVDLRERWTALLSGGIGAAIPEAVAKDPTDKAAQELQANLNKVSAEQLSNVAFYAGPKGILGMGTRWGSWVMAEELVPQAGKEIHDFRTWDIIRKIHTELTLLERGALKTGFPKPTVKHWIVSPVGEGADEVSRPSGDNIVNYEVKPHEIQRICNDQQFGAGNRHYLGVQFTMWDGQLVLTMMVTVTALHHTLRVEVTGHALGPVHGFFGSKPKGKSKEVSKTVRFWETREIKLPLTDTDEVVRQAVRAPLTWFPPILEFLGGKLVLPEPFGLRHAWAGQPWRNRFMADDALRMATPVLRAVHAATIKALDEHNVDTDRFTSRALGLAGGAADASPKKADLYDA